MSASYPSLLNRLRELPGAAWILFAGTFINRFGAFVVPFLALYMTRLGFSPAEAGLAIAAFGAGHFAASGVGGHLADRIGRRNTIALSMFSSAVMMLILSQAQGLFAFILLSGLSGFATELYRPASSALLIDLVKPSQRVMAFAVYRLAINAGWAVGPLTAGFMAKHSYLWLFIGDAITSVIFGALALVALPHGVRAGRIGLRIWGDLTTILKDQNFLRCALASLAIGMVFMQMGSTLSVYITSHGFSEAIYGAVVSLNGILIVLFELPLTTFTEKRSPRKMMAAGFLFIGAGFALNAVAHTVPVLLIAMTIFTVGEMICLPVTSAYVAGLAPEHMRGRYMGVMGLFWAASMVCGPALGLALFSYSPVLVWLLCGVAGVLAAVIISYEPKPLVQAAGSTARG